MAVDHTDTIAALSTATTPAARMILRVTGPEAHALARALTRCDDFSPGSATQQFLYFNGLSFPAWVYFFRAPNSYTGDDLIELHIPGSPVLAKLLLDELFRRGARHAEPGEFTARAYFNGKLDLTEAEGVSAIIAAGNESELRAARQLLAGELARRLDPIMNSLAQTLALIEVGIDFSEEQVTFLAADEVARQINVSMDALDNLVEQSSQFEQLSHEPSIVLAGRPNAGKSSLMNALTGRARAVVSETAGTTRDVLSAPLDLPRGRVILIDAAGLENPAPLAGTPREAGPDAKLNQSVHTQIDLQMQARARSAIESASCLVLVRDVTDERPSFSLPRAADLTVFTKSDLLRETTSDDRLLVSVRTNHRIDDLREALDRLAFGSSTVSGLALNRRHLSSIADARLALARAGQKSNADAAELVAAELREALDHLGNILGNITPDDVLGRIFAGFCIGK